MVLTLDDPEPGEDCVSERQNAIEHFEGCIAEQTEMRQQAEAVLREAEADPSTQAWVLDHWREQIEWADRWMGLYRDRRAELLGPG